MNIPWTAEGPAFFTTTTASTLSSFSNNSPASASTMDPDQSAMPFGGAHHHGLSYDPSALDFSTNIDINTGTFVGGSFDLGMDSVAMAKGLENLGQCQNAENACLDQRCYHVISNAATAASSHKRHFESDINLEADLPLQYSTPAHKRHASVDLPFRGPNPDHVNNMGSFAQPVQTSTTEPIAVLHSLHDSIHEGISHAPNNFTGQMNDMQPTTAALHSLHYNMQQSSNQFSQPSTCQGFSQPSAPYVACPAPLPMPDQVLYTPAPVFVQSGGGFEQHPNGMAQAPQGQWTQVDWDAFGASINAHPYPSFPPAASRSSRCGRADCASNCGKSANGDCCFDPSCATGDARRQPAASNFCSRESCRSEAAPCMEADCPQPHTACSDVACLETVVTGTPLSNPILTPPASGSDSMGNHSVTTFDGTGDAMAGLMSDGLASPVGNMSNGLANPIGNMSGGFATPVGNMSGGFATPVGNMSDGLATPMGNMSNGFANPMGNMSNGLATPVDDNADGAVESWPEAPPLPSPTQMPSANAGEVEDSADAGEVETFTCQWQCDDGLVCSAEFPDSAELQAHCKAVHTDKAKKVVQNGFFCKWIGCARTLPFAQKSKLDRHTQTHTGYKPVQCEYCGLRLSAKQSLEQHIRVHTEELPWACNYQGCTKRFKQQSALTMHHRTHTGEKPLKCTICGKRFSESSNLSKHRRTHNVKGRHVCNYCPSNFHRLDQLRRHVKTIHKAQRRSASSSPDVEMTNVGIPTASMA